MNCDQVPLFRFSRGELNPASAGRMAAHVAGCNTCAQRLQVMVALQEYHRKRELRWRRSRWLLVAAALALAVATVAVEKGLLQDGPPGPSVVAVEFPYPLVLLNNRSEVDADRRAAYQVYLNGDYSRAELLLRGSTLEMDLLLRGVSLYMLEREEEALTVLGRVPHESVWREAARWYEANALIRLGEWKAARRLLRRLSADAGEYSDRAALLVQRLGDGS